MCSYLFLLFGILSLSFVHGENNGIFLTPFIKSGNASLCRSLTEVDSSNFFNIKSHSGFITVNETHNSNLYFWYYPHENPEETPWIIWLQGGPGFSSLFGLFELIGPFKVEDSQLKLRNVSWASSYSLLFIDQPVGAGFSFTEHDAGYTKNVEDVTTQLYEFLKQFLQVFPELREAPLFVAGESYGKYVSAFGVQLHRHKDDDDAVNFRGISLGNPIIDPRSMLHYSELCGVLGILEGNELKALKTFEQETMQSIDQNRLVDAANKINETVEFIKKQSGVYIENFNRDPQHENYAFEKFINREEVRNWIHAGNATFDLDNRLVYETLLADITNSSKDMIEELLEHYGVMCYSGQLDLIAPYGMWKHTVRHLDWSHRGQYDAADRVRLRSDLDKSVQAYKKSGGNFVEVLVRRAGHFVPKDQPTVMKYLIDTFVHEFQ